MPRPFHLTKIVLSLVLVACAAVFAIGTLRWPLIGDATLMHYIVFLMHHGMAPYRDIVDMNMPGAYLLEKAVMMLFGDGALGWRIFDLTLMAGATGAMIYIAWPYDRFAGLFGGVLLALVHGSDGIPHAGQRDFSMAVLILLAYAFFLYAMRKGRIWAALLFGFFISAAATLKPTVLPLNVLLLLFAIGELKKRERPFIPFLLWSAVGMVLPISIVFLFLQREHSVHAFLWTFFHLVPYDASLGRRPLSYLLQHCLSPIQPLVILWLFLLLSDWRSKNWEYLVLITGAAFGLFSYVVQGKGYPYHRYSLIAFMLLLAGMEYAFALRRSRSFQILGLVGLLYGSLMLAPLSVRKTLLYQGERDDFQTSLRGDLNALGGKALSRRVQCIDMSAGCIKTLYHMKLIQTTGFLYEYYLLSPQQNDVTEKKRNDFWQAIQATPPEVIVVTSQDYLVSNAGFEKLRRWPQFEQYLSQKYSVYRERTFTLPERWEPRPAFPSGYRIYILKTSHPFKA